MTHVLMAGAPALMTVNHHLAKRGRTSPTAGHRHCSGEFLLCIVACLSLLLCRDADLYPLTGSGLLSWMIPVSVMVAKLQEQVLVW
jgi:hypothetical protein